MGNEINVAELERRGWEALSTGPREAQSFYGDLLADDAEMLFPGGLRLVGKDRILESMDNPPWAAFEISELHVLNMSETSKAVTYKVVARREGTDPYHALVSSIYALQLSEWRLVVHQHSPE